MKIEWSGKGKFFEAEVSEDFLAWFAGFWEGEGWIRIDRRILILAIGQTNKEVIESIKDHFNIGHVTTEIRPKNRKTMYKWTITNGMNVIKLVKRMEPYMQFRKEHCKKKIAEWLEIQKTFKRRYWTIEEVRELTKKYNEYVVWGTEEDKIFAKENRRTVSSVKSRRQNTGLIDKKLSHKCETWSPEETNLLKKDYFACNHWGHKEDRDFSKKVGRTFQSIKRKRTKSGFVGKLGRPRWQPEVNAEEMEVKSVAEG